MQALTMGYNTADRTLAAGLVKTPVERICSH